MSSNLLMIVTALYFGVAIDLALDHRYGMSIAFIAYALANVGLVIAIVRGEGS